MLGSLQGTNFSANKNNKKGINIFSRADANFYLLFEEANFIRFLKVSYSPLEAQ